MNGTDPRWAWWTDAMETVADRLEELKERKRSDTAETVDHRIAEWLGRLHNAGFWLEMSHAGNGRTTATIRTMLGEDRSREEMIVTVKPDLKTERCSWFVDMRSDEPGPAGDPPDGPDRARARDAARRIAGAAMKTAHDDDASAAWRTYARYFRNPSETQSCKQRLLETLSKIGRWSETLAPVSELRAQFSARHATLDTEHDERGRVAKLSVGVPVVVPRSREPGKTDRGWADLTVARTPDDRWRLDTRGAGRLVEAAIQADRNSTMSLSRIAGILKRVATRAEMQKAPDEAAATAVQETAPTRTTRWLHGRGPMTYRECGRGRGKSCR